MWTQPQPNVSAGKDPYAGFNQPPQQAAFANGSGFQKAYYPGTDQPYDGAAYQSQNVPPSGYIKYVPVGYSDTHSVAVGYALWLIGFTGAHRFYYGKPLTGILWFFTFGLLGFGWIIDAFLIPSMDREADRRYRPGRLDYNVAWLLLVFGGIFGLHRFYAGKIISGLLYFFTVGLFGFGYIYDVLTLNTQVDHLHANNENPIYY